MTIDDSLQHPWIKVGVFIEHLYLLVEFQIRYKIWVITYQALHEEAPEYISKLLFPYTVVI